MRSPLFYCRLSRYRFHVDNRIEEEIDTNWWPNRVNNPVDSPSEQFPSNAADQWWLTSCKIKSCFSSNPTSTHFSDVLRTFNYQTDTIEFRANKRSLCWAEEVNGYKNIDGSSEWLIKTSQCETFFGIA